MTNVRTNYYEAMFLISQATAADFGGAIDHIKELLGRSHAEIVALRKWDERRLAFEINGQKRGVFVLAYFKAPSTSIDTLTRDCNLSERILRCLVLKADHLTIEEMQSADERQALDDEARLRGEPARSGGMSGDEAEEDVEMTEA